MHGIFLKSFGRSIKVIVKFLITLLDPPSNNIFKKLDDAKISRQKIGMDLEISASKFFHRQRQGIY